MKAKVVPSPGTATPLTVVSMVKSGDQDLPGDSYVDLTDWISTSSHAAVTQNLANGELTVNIAGRYILVYTNHLEQFEGNNRTTSNTRFSLNGGLLPGSEQATYHRDHANGSDSCTANMLAQLNVGDVLVMQAKNSSATLRQRVVAAGTSVTMILVGAA
ncbi:MAG: hypothetical protein ACPGNV_14215 [Mangrovicoccus sp.]